MVFETEHREDEDFTLEMAAVVGDSRYGVWVDFLAAGWVKGML